MLAAPISPAMEPSCVGSSPQRSPRLSGMSPSVLAPFLLEATAAAGAEGDDDSEAMAEAEAEARAAAVDMNDGHMRLRQLLKLRSGGPDGNDDDDEEEQKAETRARRARIKERQREAARHSIRMDVVTAQAKNRKKELRDTFNMLDKDGSGSIDMQVWCNMLTCRDGSGSIDMQAQDGTGWYGAQDGSGSIDMQH